MTTLMRWTAGTFAIGMVLLATHSVLDAQQATPPASGKALAEQIGLTGDAAVKLEPQLDKLVAALATDVQAREQALDSRAEVRSALAAIVPSLDPEQRQRLRGVLMQNRAGFGSHMGYGASGRMGGGMGYGMQRGMGYGMQRGMGYGMHRGMGYGMHRGMGQGMGYGMGQGMGYGPQADCPFNQAPSTDQPGAGSNDGPGGR